MEYFTLIVKMALGLTFLISGIAKVVDIRRVSQEQIGIFNKDFEKVIVVSMPFIEIFIGTSLINGKPNVLINIITSLIILVFILLNLKDLHEGKNSECICFGKLIKTELGLGGVYHSMLLLVFLIPSFIWDSIPINSLIMHHGLMITISVFITSFFLFLTGLFMRTTITLLYK